MEAEIYKITDLHSELRKEIERLPGLEGSTARKSRTEDIFGAFSSDGSLLGVVTGKRFDGDCLLKHLAVRSDYQNKGTGSGLTGRFLSSYSGICERCYALSLPEMKGFFERFGFEQARSGALPDHIRETEYLQDIEIAGIVVMILKMPKKWPIV